MKGKKYLKGYFYKNLGDDLFVKIILERYKNEKFEMYSSINYKKVYKTDNLKIYSNWNIEVIFKRIINLILMLFKSERRIKLEDYINYDIIILIAGSFFMEPKDFNPKIYFKNIFNQKGNLYIIGSNFGPFNDKEYFNIHKNKIFKNAIDVCFRDKYSYNLFKELPNVRYAPDIIFSLNTENIKITNRNRVIISVINCKKDQMEFINQDVYNKKICEFINFFEKMNYEVTLISFSKEQGDEGIVNKIIKMCKSKKVSKYFYRGNIDEALDVIGDSRIVVGTRFHANILGLIMNKVVIPIAYSDKTLNVLNDINFKGRVFDIRKMDEFDVNCITSKDLNYKLNVDIQKKEAEKHFRELDKIFK